MKCMAIKQSLQVPLNDLCSCNFTVLGVRLNSVHRGDIKILLCSHLPSHSGHRERIFSPVIKKKITVNHFSRLKLGYFSHAGFPFLLPAEAFKFTCRNNSLVYADLELIYLVSLLEPPHCSSDYQPLFEQRAILHLLFFCPY